MILTGEEIKRLGIVENLVDKHLHPLNYDITVGTILETSGTVVNGNEYVLKPQGIVYVISHEVVNLIQKPVIGYATIKTGNSREGILATNIGLIDPNYCGYLSSILINFGSIPKIITIGDVFLRVTFHQTADQITFEPEQNHADLSEYLRKARSFVSSRLGEDFLDIQKQVARAGADTEQRLSKLLLNKVLPWASIALAILVLVIPLLPTLYGPLVNTYASQDEKRLDNRIEVLEQKLSTADLVMTVKNLNARIDSLNDEVMRLNSLRLEGKIKGTH